MTKRTRAGLKLIGVPVEPDLHAAITQFADENGVEGADGVVRPLPLASVCRDLLRKVFEIELEVLVARDLGDAGYNEGLRRGLSEARSKIHGALKGGWK